MQKLEIQCMYRMIQSVSKNNHNLDRNTPLSPAMSFVYPFYMYICSYVNIG